MAEKQITLDQCISFLNEINKLDPSVLPLLMNYRVVANKALQDHPTIQVGSYPEGFKVGFVGLLNGLFGDGSFGPIVAIMGPDGIAEFKRG